MHVLILEDDGDLGLLLQEVLARNGFECMIARSIAASRALIESQAFDFLLLDLLLPDGSAMELLPKLAGGLNQKAIVIVSSGNVNAAIRGDSRISAVFQKPYEMSSLIRFMKAA